MKKRKLIADICAFLLIFLFVFAATAKLFRFDLWLFQLASYPWIGPFARPIGWGWPFLLLVLAGLLLSRRGRRSGFFMTLSLLSLLTIYLILMVATQDNLPCACGGIVQGLKWWQTIVLNFLFIGVAAAGIVCESPVRGKRFLFHQHKKQFYET